MSGWRLWLLKCSKNKIFQCQWNFYQCQRKYFQTQRKFSQRQRKIFQRQRIFNANEICFNVNDLPFNANENYLSVNENYCFQRNIFQCQWKYPSTATKLSFNEKVRKQSYTAHLLITWQLNIHVTCRLAYFHNLFICKTGGVSREEFE